MAIKFNAPIDLSKSELRNAVIQNLASDPSSPLAGQIYYNTGGNQLEYYNGSAFVVLATGTTPDATTSSKGIVELAGDIGGSATSVTVTNLHLSGDTSIGHKLTNVTDPGSAQDAATQNYVVTRTLTTFGAPTGDLSIGSHKLTNVTDPSSSSDAATKNYVDNVAQGLSPKPAARVATVGTETFTVASGSVTQITGTTVDGVSPSVNDRILVKDAPATTGVGSVNSTQPGNGLYIVTSNTSNLSLSRDTSMDDSNDPPGGAYVFIEAGTANGSAGYVVSTPSSGAAFTYGTNNIQWTQFTGAGEITAGTGLSKSGNTLSLSTPVTVGNGGTNATSASNARTNLVVPVVYTTTITGTGAQTSFTVTPTSSPVLTGAWHVAIINQTTGMVEYCDVTINQSTNVITLAFTNAPANGLVYSVVVVG